MFENFDPEAEGRSPPLEAVKPTYDYVEPDPPFVKADDKRDLASHVANAHGAVDRSRKPHLPETQIQTHLGDSVLMRHLGPDHPEVAAGLRDPTSWPLPKREAPGLSWDDWGRSGQQPADTTRSQYEPQVSARSTGWSDNDRMMDVEEPGRLTSTPKLERPAPLPPPPPPPAPPPPPPPFVSQKSDRPLSLSPPTNPPATVLPPIASPSKIKHDVVSPPQRPRLQSITEFPHMQTSAQISSEPSGRAAPISLPSIQSLSPPSSAAGTSPDSASCNAQGKILPSIQSALGDLSHAEFSSARLKIPYSSCPNSATSTDSPHDRSHVRHFFASSIPPSPYSHLSPISLKDVSNHPSPASQPPSALWRGLPPPSGPSPAAHSSVETPNNPATPFETSPMAAHSPLTSYPTPTEPIVASPGSTERASIASTVSQNGTGAPGGYRCTHLGCTAAPFQTQYLLNSHANVHSQDRPHFCPVEGCPRGFGGKGFKRKNEMMRHGLVHNSPGYVCPFCPDQQHKYPRPDNLQRHVRVHHVDKNKDDPILRQVLAQRPIGSTRGRRRRSNFA
ncbi:Zinc finger C2H2 type domain-containing protein [Penicillium ucsense]|uniref:Zinc finger C2H2 type domain-containing protein n=1 Tax=Penicillium ucsense TaxID=2839758 RepID=A0A8J8WFS3_9EURO|nr:Zinc finger C2H2 type domain-containing protein [Penicillium ucsense]KAF7733097.1 Zinc finger C2H2 type domain-containing protein [Penicillium ucsense]